MYENTISGYFNGINDVFNPNITYDGNYGFPLESLYQCSKVEDGRNLVSEYFQKNYLRGIFSLLKGYENALGDFMLVSDVSPDNNGRDLKLSIDIIVLKACFALVGDTPQLDGDPTNYKEILQNFFRRYKRAIILLQSKGNHEGYEKECETILKRYKINEQFRKDKYGKNYRTLDIYSFLEKLKDGIVGFLFAYRRLEQICNKSINLSELEGLLDLEKFYFIMAKHLLDASLMAEKIDGKLHNSFVYVDLYINSAKYLKEHNGYDMKLKFATTNEGRKLVSLDELINTYNALKNRHPEFRLYTLEPESGVNYQNIDVANSTKKRIEQLATSNQLSASWKFIRKGKIERDKGGPGRGVIYPRVPWSAEEKSEELRKRIDFFESTDYMYRIEGINNFDGYIGYIYQNGTVIFEKFYKNTITYELALSNATYIMNLDNFVDMSKKTKAEIMEYIRQGNNDVKRRYHTSKWQQKITSLIEGNDYDRDTISLIDNLIESGEIKKKGYNNE